MAIVSMGEFTTRDHKPVVDMVYKYTSPVFFKLFMEYSDRMYICGGALRALLEGEKPNDIDVYCSDVKTANEIIDRLAMDEYKIVAETDRAVTLLNTYNDTAPAVQVITFVTGSLLEVLSEFDFTIVTMGATYNSFILHIDAADDVDAKMLRYMGSRAPLSSLQRAFKYARRGYHMRAKEIVSILRDINAKVDINDEEAVREAIRSFDPNALEEEF